jgi:hypothetical protein
MVSQAAPEGATLRDLILREGRVFIASTLGDIGPERRVLA